MTLKASAHVRIKRILDELEAILYRNRNGKFTGPMVPEGGEWSITELYRLPDDLSAEEAMKSEGEPFASGGFWGSRDEMAWFRAKIRIPSDCEGYAAVAEVSTGREPQWNARNPQFICYVDGVLRQGLDTNHRQILLAEHAVPGTEYDILLQAWAGLEPGQSRLSLRLLAIDRELERLVWNIRTPWEAAEILDEGDANRAVIEKHLNAAINLLDLRDASRPEFSASVRDANRYLEEEFYGKACGKDDGPVVDLIGQTHIDVAWQWRLKHTRRKAARSFASVLENMDQYPDFLFMMSQPQLYQYVKEDEPELYRRIAEKVREGRWEPEGAMWLEADCNITGGEALVRQILLGKAFFRQEYGVENRVLWLPDVFGYSAALPQILRKSGVDYFMTTKITWNQYNQMPFDTFMWRGIDGTEVLTHYITTIPKSQYDRGDRQTTYNGKVDADSVLGSWIRYQNKDLNDHLLLCYGYGDGGGGPVREDLERAERLAYGIPGIPKVRHGKVLDYFRSLEKRVSGKKDLPTWVGELYLEYHRGTYTSMARNKKYNRRSEQLLQKTEKFWALLPQYPAEELRGLWRTVLLNQFHDILPGSSIREVYEDSREQYEALLAEGSALFAKAQELLAHRIRTDKNGFVLFNPAPVSRSDAILIPGVHVSLTADGKELPSQITEEGTWTRLPEIPENGYRAVTAAAAEDSFSPCLQEKPVQLENSCLRLTFAEDGTLDSIFDKRTGREVLQKGCRGNVLTAFEDKPMNYDAWDLEPFYAEKSWEIDDLTEFRLLEQGPVRTVVGIRRRFLSSEVKQKVILWEDSARIDFETEIDWHEKQIMVKAAFPVDIVTDHASFAIQYGAVSRPTHENTSWDKARFESCAHAWADVSEAGYGVSLLNDCKYGHDVHGSTLRLTLLKSAVFPNEEADREIHRFTYSLFPHEGDWREGNTVAEAARLNLPVSFIGISAQDGDLPEIASIASADRKNILIEAIKESEDGKAVIIRLYDSEGRRTRTNIRTLIPFQAAALCDLMENPLETLTPESDGSIAVEVRPFEIVSIRLEK